MKTIFDIESLKGKGLIFVVLHEIEEGKPEALIMSLVFLENLDNVLLVTGDINGAREFIRSYNDNH